MNININGYCPHCNADLDGELVIDYPLKQGKTKAEAIEYASFYQGWSEHGELNRWNRKMGFAENIKTTWRCPDCLKEIR